LKGASSRRPRWGGGGVDLRSGGRNHRRGNKIRLSKKKRSKEDRREEIGGLRTKGDCAKKRIAVNNKTFTGPRTSKKTVAPSLDQEKRGSVRVVAGVYVSLNQKGVGIVSDFTFNTIRKGGTEPVPARPPKEHSVRVSLTTSFWGGGKKIAPKNSEKT